MWHPCTVPNFQSCAISSHASLLAYAAPLGLPITRLLPKFLSPSTPTLPQWYNLGMFSNTDPPLPTHSTGKGIVKIVNGSIALYRGAWTRSAIREPVCDTLQLLSPPPTGQLGSTHPSIKPSAQPATTWRERSKHDTGGAGPSTISNHILSQRRHWERERLEGGLDEPSPSATKNRVFGQRREREQERTASRMGTSQRLTSLSLSAPAPIPLRIPNRCRQCDHEQLECGPEIAQQQDDAPLSIPPATIAALRCDIQEPPIQQSLLPPSRPPSPEQPLPALPAVNYLSIGQCERRERERHEREWLTQVPGARAADSPQQQDTPACAPPHRTRAQHAGNALPPARQPYREPAARHDLGRMDVPCRHCGALHWIGKRVGKSSVTSPDFGLCCDHGQVVLDALEDPPHTLWQLFLGATPQSCEFLDNIRQYNTAFAFTSLGVSQDHAVNQGVGPLITASAGTIPQLHPVIHT
ncbi:hypothetical protein FIBSPDRAFT_900326 [Athelia psychrophila]|uniref:Helitron helicase-like domain-containing protein n=1 Tax=Athelia psychrophila TaxID=1759441 RepID=A0A165YKB9_9AGAM|nr:hypothetical protein FIBSPDRAFT_900326 [Fibularhizoctonia sp. CBS 109695]